MNCNFPAVLILYTDARHDDVDLLNLIEFRINQLEIASRLNFRRSLVSGQRNSFPSSFSFRNSLGNEFPIYCH